MKNNALITLDDVHSLLAQSFGSRCCVLRTTGTRGLVVGFGAAVFHSDSRLKHPFSAELEIATYYSAWRITDGGKVVCGSGDLDGSSDSLHQMDDALARIRLRIFERLDQIGNLDVRLTLSEGLQIEFFLISADVEEECVVIYHAPSLRTVTFRAAGGWRVGSSDEPWD